MLLGSLGCNKSQSQWGDVDARWAASDIPCIVQLNSRLPLPNTSEEGYAALARLMKACVSVSICVQSKRDHHKQRLDGFHSLHFCNILEMLALKHLGMISRLHMINTVGPPLTQKTHWVGIACSNKTCWKHVGNARSLWPALWGFECLTESTECNQRSITQHCWQSSNPPFHSLYRNNISPR